LQVLYWDARENVITKSGLAVTEKSWDIFV